MNTLITLGGIYSRGFDLFKKKYKKFLLIAVIMFAISICVSVLIQYLTMPVQLGATYLFEFALIALMSANIIPMGGDFSDFPSDGFSYSGGNTWRDFSGAGTTGSAFSADMGKVAAIVFFVAAILLLVVFCFAVTLTKQVASGTFAVGTRHAAIALAEGQTPSLDASFGFFGKNWRRCFGVTAWATLWTVLWGFLFLVPGIVKSYSYRFAPYLIVQYPDMTVRQALRKSMEMTRGHKGKLFVLDLSLAVFALCALVASCCFYFIPLVAGVMFFILPLEYALFAEAYVEIKRAAGSLPPSPVASEPIV